MFWHYSKKIKTIFPFIHPYVLTFTGSVFLKNDWRIVLLIMILKIPIYFLYPWLQVLSLILIVHSLPVFHFLISCSPNCFINFFVIFTFFLFLFFLFISWALITGWLDPCESFISYYFVKTLCNIYNHLFSQVALPSLPRCLPSAHWNVQVTPRSKEHSLDCVSYTGFLFPFTTNLERLLYISYCGSISSSLPKSFPWTFSDDKSQTNISEHLVMTSFVLDPSAVLLNT